MKTFIGIVASLAVAGSCAFTQVALADSTDATCEFYSHGDKKKDRSGPCTFSQRQGFVDITLSNGKTFNLSPKDKPDHFKDQEDHKVVRKKASGNEQVYKWDQKKIVVTFHQAAAAAPAQSGDKVAVKDMGKYCAGEASAKFNQKPNRITTQNAVKDHGMYSVWGQYEHDPNPQLFICTFSAEGKLVGVDKHTP